MAGTGMGNWRDHLAGLESAAAAGLEIRGQATPRAVSFIFGLDLTLHPFALHPSFQEIADLPPAAEVFHVEQLSVPELSAERCIVWLRRKTDGGGGAPRS